MEADVTRSAQARTFPVDYERLFGMGSSRDFRGTGTLVVGPGSEPEFTFTGRRRRLFGGPGEMRFDSGRIRNVKVDGLQVQFATDQGRAGAEHRPFVFYCRDYASAAEIAALLPRRRDEAFAAGNDFAARLKALGGGSSPWFAMTNLIIGANVAVFVAMGFLGAGWVEASGLQPYILYGANNAGITTDGEWWRLVTSMFLHYGILHLALNMWALFQVGLLVEKLLGRLLYTVTYLGSGIIGGLTSLLWHGDRIWSVGASGAIFGIYGALIGYLGREHHALPGAVFRPMLKSTLLFAGYNLIFGFVYPQIDNAAHLGGVVSGVALGWLMALPLDAALRARLRPRRLIAGVVAIAVAVGAGVRFAPRYDYHLREEMAWDALNRAEAAKEQELVEQQQNQLTGLRLGRSGAETGFVRWIRGEAIPFYEDWTRQLKALELAPDKRTARHRAALAEVLEQKLADYRQLAEGVASGDGQAFERYRKAEKALGAKLARSFGSRKTRP